MAMALVLVWKICNLCREETRNTTKLCMIITGSTSRYFAQKMSGEKKFTNAEKIKPIFKKNMGSLKLSMSYEISNKLKVN